VQGLFIAAMKRVLTRKFQMNRQEYIFKHASEISERQERAAQKLQSEEAQRICMAALAVLKNWFLKSSRLADRDQQKQY
jgi:hypothetical protein